MPSRKHQHYLTFAGRVALTMTTLAVAFILVFTFWPGAEQHVDTLDAHPAPPPDVVRLGDLRIIEDRLKRLEAFSRNREQMQQEAVRSILESKVRLRTLEDQLGMVRVSGDEVRKAVTEIRDMLREHVVVSRPLLEEHRPKVPEPQPVIPGTVH